MQPTTAEALKIARDALEKIAITARAKDYVNINTICEKALAATADVQDSTPQPAQPVAPAGYKLVPIEPTEEMMHAAVKEAPCIIREYYKKSDSYTGRVTSMNSSMFGEAYKAMLKAAPAEGKK